MKNTPLTRFGKYSTLVLFFILAVPVYAETCTDTQMLDSSTNGFAINVHTLGNTNANYAYGEEFAYAQKHIPQTLSVYLSKQGNPTDAVQAYSVLFSPGTGSYIYNRSDTILATNIATSATKYTFTFATTAKPIEFGEVYFFGIARTSAISGSNYYRVWGNTSSDFDHILKNTFLYDSTSADGGWYEYSGIICVPSTSTGTTTDTNMASTTEAIYTVGQMLQLYLGIFVIVLFGYMAYMFTRKFI